MGPGRAVCVCRGFGSGVAEPEIHLGQLLDLLHRFVPLATSAEIAAVQIPHLRMAVEHILIHNQVTVLVVV